MGMSVGVKVDTSQLQNYSNKIKNLTGEQKELFYTNASREMAGRLLALVIPRTPVGKSHKENGKTVRQGGTLRRGWIADVSSGTTNRRAPNPAEINGAVKSLQVEKVPGGYYNITIVNSAPYASYVEYGHRQTPGRYVPAIGKRLKANWVEGKHFLQLSEQDLQKVAPSVLEKLLDNFLRQVF